MTIASIPGTNYQLQGTNILDAKGATVSPDQFLQKVQNKEISLTADSLQFLGEHLGPDLKKSLTEAAGVQTPVSLLSQKVSDGDKVSADLYSLMRILAEISQEQRKSMMEVKHSEFDMQIDAMKTSADEQMKAAGFRLAAGIASGVMTMGAGALSAHGGALGGNENMQMFKGLGDMSEGYGKIVSAVFEYGAAQHDNASKMADIASKKIEQAVGESKDLIDSLNQMNSKVREMLKEIQSAQNETNKSIARM